jgi:hypothetical protein
MIGETRFESGRRFYIPSRNVGWLVPAPQTDKLLLESLSVAELIPFAIILRRGM